MRPPGRKTVLPDAALAGDASAAADINLLRVRIQGLADGERITLGNLF